MISKSIAFKKIVIAGNDLEVEMIVWLQLQLVLLASVAAVYGSSWNQAAAKLLLTAAVTALPTPIASQKSNDKGYCQPKLRQKYCNAWYGGDLHTGKWKPFGKTDRFTNNSDGNFGDSYVA